MYKKTLLLTMLLAVFMPWAANAQNTVTGTPTGSYFAFKDQGVSDDNSFLAIDGVTVKERNVVVANLIVADGHVVHDQQMTWDQFAQYVNNGDEFGYEIYLMEDITVTTMAGTEANPFQGTFNGNGHTITVNLTAIDDNFTAPFRVIRNATIKNLTVTGILNDAGYKFCAGFAGDCYGNNTFTNCVSDVTINATISGDGTHGGFIARNLAGVAFDQWRRREDTEDCGSFSMVDMNPA